MLAIPFYLSPGPSTYASCYAFWFLHMDVYFYLSDFAYIFIHSEIFTEHQLCAGHSTSGDTMASKADGLLPRWCLESGVENQC